MSNQSWWSQKYLRKHIHILTIIFCLVLVVLLSGCIKNKPVVAVGPKAIGMPVDVETASLKPGLDVMYLSGFWRHIKVVRPETFEKEGWQGKPIKKIDHRFGEKEVFDSGKTRGIGVQMSGFIKLPRPGIWQFKVKSNDGIDIKIAHTQVAWDPAVHSDRFSKPMDFKAVKSGWYPILVRYFQRKGTATLEFYWKPPGASEFTIIPESAYWHLDG